VVKVRVSHCYKCSRVNTCNSAAGAPKDKSPPALGAKYRFSIGTAAFYSDPMRAPEKLLPS
jgi:hypothetical protein